MHLKMESYNVSVTQVLVQGERSGLQDLRAALSQENVQERANTQKAAFLFVIVMPLSLFALNVVLYTVACVLAFKELYNFTRLLLDFDHSLRMEVTQPSKETMNWFMLKPSDRRWWWVQCNVHLQC